MKLAPLPLVVLLALVSWASGQVTDGQWTYIVEDGGATITASTATGAVTIPSVLGGYAVKNVGIGSWTPVFGRDNTSVTSVVIPNGVTTIGDQAFRYLDGLTSASIGNGVTSIGVEAFAGCKGLTSVNIGNGVTSIGEEAFVECIGLTSVSIPDSVTSIGFRAFASCTGLTSVSISSGVFITVGTYAFGECPLVGTITLPLIATVPPGAFPNGVTITRSSASLVTLIANEIVAALPNNYGIATKADLGTAVSDATAQAIAQVQAAPNGYNLFSPTQYQANRITGVAEGKAEVIEAPGSYGLYDSTSIMDLRMGGLMIQKQGTDATIVFQPQTTTDLVTLPFTNNGPPITNAIPMPGDKGFLRVGAGATVGGGAANTASGLYSYVGGASATASHTGSYVYNGDYGEPTASFGDGTFTVRSEGGARFYTANGIVGAQLPAAATAWDALSDSNSKTDFEPIKPREILSKVAALPVKAWHYKHDRKRLYIGPMAQDFHGAFGLGSSDKTISTLDSDGVMYAAIQGLVEELKDRDAKIGELEASGAGLKAKMEAMEERLNSLPPAR